MVVYLVFVAHVFEDPVPNRREVGGKVRHLAHWSGGENMKTFSKTKNMIKNTWNHMVS